MIALIIIALVASTCNGLSIGSVSEKNVTKRNAEAGDIFPDWVPFKNKEGEVLGEIIQVERKAKPKKRLALPVNFRLRAVAEPQGDDYYDKGQGESDDYFEKKDWSDLNRNAQASGNSNPVNHTDISDIDGVVSILTKKQDDPVVEALNNPVENKARNVKETEQKEDLSQETKEENVSEESKSVEVKKEDKKRGYEDDVEYEESSVEKTKSDQAEDEQSDNEAKKASILDSVDELKERHAKEQRFISEKVKEEEIFKEQHERESQDSQRGNDKYDQKGGGKKLTDYEDYEEKDASLEDKYKISPLRIRTTTPPPPPTTTKQESKRTKKRKGKKESSKLEVPGKLSVFKNPQLYVVYDDDIDDTTTTFKPTQSRTTKARGGRFSSRFTMTTPSVPNSEENVRLSFVPQDTASKEGEPTLFFPKKRKNKRKKVKTTPATDSYVAETIAGKAAKGSATAFDTTASGSRVSDTTAANTYLLPLDATAADTLSSRLVTDALPASSDHKKESAKDENYDIKRGVGRKFHSETAEEHVEHGKKAYELVNNVTKAKSQSKILKPKHCYYDYTVDMSGVHDDSKADKGHHDKANHLDKYNDHGGVEKEHLDESSHYGGQHHEEHGKKHAKYEESGKHSKGHSTKGSHDIHKKEEYEKKVEFFEEEGDSDEEEKHGGHKQEHGHSEGSKFEKGGLDAGYGGKQHGESGDFANGGHVHVHKGHKAAAGHDGHGHRGEGHHHQEGRDSGKKWIYHHGRPAKTANLVVIDRRSDMYTHGPQYYG